jgi:hypothetical protein
MRGNLIEELEMLPWRVGAGSVAPYQYREGLLGIEYRQILWSEDGMCRQRSFFLHHGLIGTRASFFYYQFLALAVCCVCHEKAAKHE